MQYKYHLTIQDSLKPIYDSIQKLRRSKSLNCRIFLIEGKSMAREKAFGAIQRFANEFPQSILLIRLNEHTIKLNNGFNLHFIKLLTQEINRKINMSEEIHEIVKVYLNPFQIEEEIKKTGFHWHFQYEKEQKIKKKMYHDEDIERNYWQCLNQLEQKNWKLILLFSSINELSENAQQFIIKFLERNKNSILLFGGIDQISLYKFLNKAGIPDFYNVSCIGFNKDKKKENKEVSSIAEVIYNAFSKSFQHFNYLKFELHAELEGKNLPGLAANKFDVCLLGHLQMRHDYPANPIRNNYDCAFLIKVFKHSVESKQIITDLCDAAFESMQGMEIEKDRWFEPWDTFLFLFTPSVSDAILKSYRHQPYRNVFLLLPNGKFKNLSPHKWMDVVLNEVSW